MIHTEASISLFLHDRLDAIMEDLRKNNAEYALAFTQRRALYDAIDPILRAQGPITLSAGDCQNFLEYFEQEFITTAVMQEALYRQGYLDCARLLGLLGV